MPHITQKPSAAAAGLPETVSDRTGATITSEVKPVALVDQADALALDRTPQPAMLREIAIADIIVGPRHRKDLGDIQSLAGSIDRLGLLHPIGVCADNRLKWGHRRLEAHRLLGLTRIPAIIVEADDGNDLLREAHENTQRLDLSPVEVVAIGKDIEEHEAALARERQQIGGELKGEACGKLPQAGKTRDKVASVVGVSGRTYAKAKSVIEAAKQDHERFGDLLEEMEASRSVDAAFRKFEHRKARSAYEARKVQGGGVEDLHTLIDAGKQFSVILADPPWEFKVYSGKGKQRSAERHYDTAGLEAIASLPVEKLAEENCALFLWAVMPELPGALEVIKRWGFQYKTAGFTWVKQNSSGEGLFTGMGYWTRANAELCLLATRGSPVRLAMDVPQVILSPVREHSQKPDETPGRIERLLAGPYLELFAREERPGWTSWGDEIPRAVS